MAKTRKTADSKTAKLAVCPTCAGAGIVIQENNERRCCPVCAGTGRLSRWPR